MHRRNKGHDETSFGIQQMRVLLQQPKSRVQTLTKTKKAEVKVLKEAPNERVWPTFPTLLNQNKENNNKSNSEKPSKASVPLNSTPLEFKPGNKDKDNNNKSNSKKPSEASAPKKTTVLEFKPGNLVNAKMHGYPYWPGLIFREATSGKFYNNKEKKYYVKFFDINKTTSSWIPSSCVTSYNSGSLITSSEKFNGVIQERVKKSIEWADYAEDWEDEDRLDYFQD